MLIGLRKQELPAVWFVSEHAPQTGGGGGSHPAHEGHVRAPLLGGHPERFGRGQASAQGGRLPRVPGSSERPNRGPSAAHGVHGEARAAAEGTHLLAHVQQKKRVPPPRLPHGGAADVRSAGWVTRRLRSRRGRSAA